MSEETLFRLAGWSAYFNAAVFLLSLVALVVFFSIGGFWGTVNDSLSVLWMFSFIPLAAALHEIDRAVNPTINLISTIIGITGALAFVVMQILLVVGLVRFEQTFSAVLATTALFGFFVLVQALLARAGHTLPPGLTWVMIIYGLASLVGAVGFQVGGEQHPLAMIGLLMTAVSGLVWVIWFGRLLLSEGFAAVMAGTV